MKKLNIKATGKVGLFINPTAKLQLDSIESLGVGLTTRGYPLEVETSTSFFLQLDKSNQEILKLCENGDIFVKGRLAENDKEVVDALKEFLKAQGLLK